MGLRAVSPVSGHSDGARQDAPIVQEGRVQEVLHTAPKDSLICRRASVCVPAPCSHTDVHHGRLGNLSTWGITGLRNYLKRWLPADLVAPGGTRWISLASCSGKVIRVPNEHGAG